VVPATGPDRRPDSLPRGPARIAPGEGERAAAGTFLGGYRLRQEQGGVAALTLKRAD
jgi:hypothetical protein